MANILHRLDRRRFRAGIFLHHRPTGPSDRFPSDVPVAWGSDQSRYSRGALPKLLFKLLRQARSCDVIVAAQEGRATLLAWLAGMLLRKPVVGMINFDWQAFGKTLRRRQTIALRLIYPRLARTVVCGEGSRQSFEQIVSMPTGQVTVIRYVIPFDHILERAADPLPGWAQDVFRKPTIVAVGRLEPQKNFPLLIRTHARARTEWNSDHNLLIVGKGSQLSQLKILSKELGVESSVFLPGHVSNPFPIVGHATVFAMSSAFEGYPLALAEALTCGVPLVSTNCPSGPAEILDNGRYGTLVPVGDESALTEALGRALTDPQHHADMTCRARAGMAGSDPNESMRAWEELLAETKPVDRSADGKSDRPTQLPSTQGCQIARFPFPRR